MLITSAMLREWAESLLQIAGTGWGPLILVAHAFLESFILPIAHDVFLITVALAQPRYALLFALMSTVASTLGNMVGYQIGKHGGKPLIDRVVSVKMFDLTKKLLHKYDAWATAIACFTPFPDKVFGLCAGAFHINFPRFVFVIFLARAARFFLVTILLFIYGEAVREFLLEHLGQVMIGILVFMVFSAVTWKMFVKYLAVKLKDEA